jgi:hypothetical protein
MYLNYKTETRKVDTERISQCQIRDNNSDNNYNNLTDALVKNHQPIFSSLDFTKTHCANF